MSESNEAKAEALMQEAERKQSSSRGFFSSLFSGSSRHEDVVDCYVRAANLFKMAKKWREAGDAFVKSADLNLKSGTKHDAATNYVDASNCYRKIDANECVQCLLRAVDIYTDMGRFSIAAKHHRSVAEIYESELSDADKAIEHYQIAADYFKGEESNSSANKCLLQVAHHSALMSQYERAIAIYEQVAANSLESNLLKYSAKEYFFKAALCQLCVDVVNAKIAVQNYEEQYPGFSDSREAKLVKALIGHVEEEDTDGFTEAVKTFDNISRLDQWHTQILLTIKRQIDDENNLC